MHTKQRFPNVTIEAMPDGLVRLEDDTVGDTCIIDLHPAQVQVVALMAGFTMPDRTATALDRLASRLAGLVKQAEELKGQLHTALMEHEIDVPAELTGAEFIAHNLRELAADLDVIRAPALEPQEGATNAGGQLSIPM